MARTWISALPHLLFPMHRCTCSNCNVCLSFRVTMTFLLLCSESQGQDSKACVNQVLLWDFQNSQMLQWSSESAQILKPNSSCFLIKLPAQPSVEHFYLDFHWQKHTMSLTHQTRAFSQLLHLC